MLALSRVQWNTTLASKYSQKPVHAVLKRTPQSLILQMQGLRCMQLGWPANLQITRAVFLELRQGNQTLESLGCPIEPHLGVYAA